MHARILLLTATWSASSLAFPSKQFEQLHKRDGILGNLLHTTSGLVQEISKDLQGALDALNPFDHNGAIDVSGIHAFHPPTATDQRGPCPGLNALANHGYIHRDGVVSLLDVVPALHHVYGMEVELGLILGIMGVVWGGAPISLNPSFSIGGNDTAVWNLLDNVQGILGTPQGIEHTHNFLEADSSPTRNDLYMTDNSWTMNMTRFEELYHTVPENGSFTFDKMNSWAAKRWHDSVETNPDFYYGPFTGMIARNAGYMFISRLFPDYTNDRSEGELSKSHIPHRP